MTTRKHRNPQSAIRNPQAKKRGIVLLIVISLLALFVLMGVAFALVAMHYKNTADLTPQIERYGDPPQREFELVLGQILYDTFARSSLQGQSMLEDAYGVDSVEGVLTSQALNLDSPPGYTGAAGQQPQVWQFTATAANAAFPFSQTQSYYAGRVMTFTGGDAAGHSTRVLDSAYDANSTQWAFAVEAIESKGPTNLRPNFSAVATQNSRFMINGAPFNGTGAGFDGTAMAATYAGPDGSGGLLTPNLIALMPHFMGYDPAGTSPINVRAGGLDESWDTPDFQNMYLAMVPPTAYAGGVPIIPSYHRPELVNYWRNNLPSEFQAGPLDAFDPTNANPPVAAQLRNFLRTFIFRPMPWEHPNFNGGNGAFDLGLVRQQAITNLTNNGQPTTEPGLSQEITRILIDNLVNTGNAPIWDVDNDNDGVPDSIWIDPGLPVVTRPDGRRYKRLVAICIKDLDGRINLNAHGNGAQVATSGGNYIYRAEYQVPSGFGVMTAPSYIPRGLGFGPAEVDFLHIFGNSGNAAAVTTYTNLLQARYASNLQPPAATVADNGGTAAPGYPGAAEPLSMVKHQGIPNSYGALTPPFLSWYASPPDVWGRGAIVLDYGGQPRTIGMGMAGEMTDQPYELSLSGEENGTDSPYTLHELERMLRYNDADMGLPYGDPAALAAHSRPLGIASGYLATSAPGAPGADEALRNLFTTHSSYISAPAHAIPRESRTGMTLGTATILDLYRSKLVNAGLTEPALSQEFRKLVPWELMHGRKFDLNRWLGDGWDTNGDGTPDDPTESFTGENVWQAPASFTGVAAQHTNNTDLNGNGAANDAADRMLARQLYARHLHCLALAMIPAGFDPQIPHEGMAANQELELVARRIAQWAINVVDFRDADSIMTAYEYDLNPWDGWHVDGNPATDGTAGNEEIINGNPVVTGTRRLVWGLEYPDLLITETLAFHDRRVKDTNQDSSGDDRDDTPNNDPTLDQFRVPQGSVFFELYCPRNTVGRNPMLPRELYDYSTPGNPRLQLGRVAPGGRPVWRMALSRIIGANETAQQQVHPLTMAANNPESASYDPLAVNLLPGGTPAGPVAIERFAYFGPIPGIPAAERPFSFYNSFSNPLVEPGQYVVVGPRITTYLGSQNPTDPNTLPAPPPGSLWGGNSRQSIVLNAGGITITDADGNTTSRTPGTDIRPAVPVVCDIPGLTPNSNGAPWSQAIPWNIGLNISEPLASGNYYPQPQLMVTPAGATQADFYADPEDPQADPAYLYLNQPVESPGVAANAGRPISDRGMTESGPYFNVSSVFLQRLANPNLAYNPPLNSDPLVAFNPALPVNPYISVDWATIDLNVFSGEENSNRTVSAGPDMGDPIDPDDDPANQPGAPDEGRPIGSRQRGFQPTAGVPDSNFWSPVVSTNPTILPNAAAPQGAYFRQNLSQNRQTFAYVNTTVGTPIGPAPNANLGEPNLTAAGQTAPWLTFHNRPFTSPMELLLVPSSSPGRICSELTPGTLSLSIAGTPYDATNGQTLRAPAGHLLNLFHTANQAGSPTAAWQLGRLLDYVEVPSPYQGAERWFTPAHFAGPYVPANNPLATYRPPFNKASRFRDPGRININTIFDERIWQAAIANSPLQSRAGGGIFWNTNGFYAKLVESRQGYGIGPYAMSPNHPTMFAAPFRSADASDLMPNLPAGPNNMSKNRPVDATFLRPDPNTPDEPLFAVRSNQGYDNTERNPYFRYQGFQKIGNTFSTTSNVFAVWMTMGYFEVEDNLDSAGVRVVDAGHPEGIRLGQEVGIDSGEIVRHRSFFIIDRSVPVGFARGQKLNTDDCILLRRFIE